MRKKDIPELTQDDLTPGIARASALYLLDGLGHEADFQYRLILVPPSSIVI
jgi:hypothetical protein